MARCNMTSPVPGVVEGVCARPAALHSYRRGMLCAGFSMASVAALGAHLAVVASADVLEECRTGPMPDRAVIACSRILEAFADSWSAHYNRGVAFTARGDTSEAMLDFNAAIRLNPGAAQPYYSRGRIHLERNDLDSAIEDFSLSLAIRRNDALALNARAWALYKQGRISDAMADVTLALAFAPSYAAAYDTRAHLHERQGRREEAIADFRKALALDPTNKSAHITREGLQRLGAKP